MKKMNNKGFLLVETIVVATFTLTVLIALFIQFKNLLVSYNNSYNYNTVEGIYNLNAVKTYIMQNQNSENPLNKTLKEKNVPYITLYSNGSCMPAAEVGVTSVTFCEQIMTSGNFKTVIFSHSNPKALKEYLKTNEDPNISEEMKNLIKRLETVDGQNRLIAEFNDGTLATIVFGVDNNAKPAEITPPTPTVNTVYRWTNDQLNLNDSIEAVDTTVDYNTLNKNYFLKHIVTDNKITSTEACFIKDGLHCLNPNEYETNKTLLLSVFGEENCNTDNSYVECNDNTLHVYLGVDKHSYVADNTQQCYINSSGESACKLIPN